MMFVDDIYEDLELWYPRLRLIEAGADVTVAGPDVERVYQASTAIPAGPTRRSPISRPTTSTGWSSRAASCPTSCAAITRCSSLVREFAGAGKLVAAICHGGWIAISAGVYRGVRVTGSSGIKDDLVNAGAHWEDAAVVVDRNFVSSRKPDDLPDFCRAIMAG